MPSSPRKTAYPATAGRTIKQSDVLHALAYFDIGAVIAYDLTPSEQERLRQNGATVLQNKIVGTPSDPVGTSSSQGIQQTSKPLNPWHLKELGLVDADGERLRELASLDMSNVIVGVIDTGVDWGHKELAGSDLWFRRYDGRSKAISRLPGARRPSDHHGHGTFVTALIKDWSVPSRKPGSQLLPR